MKPQNLVTCRRPHRSHRERLPLQSTACRIVRCLRWPLGRPPPAQRIARRDPVVLQDLAQVRLQRSLLALPAPPLPPPLVPPPAPQPTLATLPRPSLLIWTSCELHLALGKKVEYRCCVSISGAAHLSSGTNTYRAAVLLCLLDSPVLCCLRTTPTTRPSQVCVSISGATHLLGLRVRRRWNPLPPVTARCLLRGARRAGCSGTLALRQGRWDVFSPPRPS